MSTTCPTCAAADDTAAVRNALLDADRPLDPPTRELLSMPPEPGGTTGAAITLFVLAGLVGLLGLRALLSGDDGGSSDAAYRVGYHYGALLVAVVLLGIGLTVHFDHRSRRTSTADRWPQSYEQWQQLHQVWRAAWLCRRCRVAFLPAAAQRPGSTAPNAASVPSTASAVPVTQFPQWAAAFARQGGPEQFDAPPAGR
ncbi:hypothetical protein [Kitasatospora sp. NPDC085464]|uniref:hypothetical protein n=1 Tax=Kitasatospora sp. NPDC085464 TaxID=3364063 RepID=UPI0037CCC264